MFDLITMLFTAGGSAGFGSLLKVFAGLVDANNASKEKLAEREMLREIREREDALAFQQMLMSNEKGSSYTRHTRRILGIIGMCTLSAATLWCCFLPEVPLVTIPAGGEGSTNSILFGLVTWQSSAEVVELSLGHIAVVSTTVVLPMIVAFYFTPGGRK